MIHHTSPLRLLLGILCCMLMPAASGADRTRIIVAGSERSIGVQIVRDIAKYVAKPADIEFDVRYSTGSPDTLMRLREGSGLQFAVLQADVALAYLGAVVRGNTEAEQLFAPIRVITPLHDDEIYFIVRSDSPLNFIHEIENARINLGPLHGGTALTGTTLYRLLFDAAIPEQKASFHSHQEALVKLTEKTLDVVVIVAPYPVRLLADMKSEAKRFVKLLKFDPSHPRAGAALKVYSATTIPTASYPNLLGEDLSALGVKNYLVSYGRNDALQSRFAGAWCHNLQRLRAEGPPALNGLELVLPPLVSGWQYSRPFERELLACREGRRAATEPCTQEERILGLCG